MSRNSNNIVLSLIIKCVISTMFSIVILSLIAGILSLKLDFDADKNRYIALAIYLLSCFIISLITTTGIRNNIFLLSVISIIPINTICIVNMICFNQQVSLALIKILLSIIICLFVTAIKKQRNSATR